MTDYTDLIVYLRAINDRYCDEAADALEAQARRIAELEAESEARLTDASAAWDLCEAKSFRIAELEAALKPYTNGVVLPGAPDEQGVIVSMTVGDLRAARAAYLGEKND